MVSPNIKTFAAKSTAGSASRTYGDRLDNIVDVKDWGAIGNGSTDDTARIQAAVDSVAGLKKGKIFFPPGTYKVTAPITFNSSNETSVIFEGVGDLSLITGNFADYILARSGSQITSGVRVVRDLKINNDHAAGGGINFSYSVGGSIENCVISAYRGVQQLASNSLQILNCKLTGGTTAGSVGVIAGNGCSLVNVDIQSYQHGIRHQNVGLQVIGGRIEMCTVGIMLGQDENGANFQSTGALIAGVSGEANQTGIDINAAAQFHITACSFGGAISMLRGLYCHGGSLGLITASAFHGSVGYTAQAIHADCNGGLRFIGVQGTTTGGAVSWLLPSDNANKLKMEQCNASQTCTVANLPAAVAGWAGLTFVVTDANGTTHSPTAAVAGGGANIVPVICRNDAGTWKWIIL